MNTVDVLREAKALLADPARWIKGHKALDADGNYAGSYRSSAAVKWCGSGALDRCSGGDIALWTAAYEAVSGVVGRSLPAFNDDAATTHADLMDAIDEAILALAGDTKAEAVPERVEVA